jgi:hypothetical protein
MKERRKSRRVPAADSLPIRNRMTNEVVGFLQDLSGQGMMVSGKGPFDLNQPYKLKVILLKPVMGVRQIELEATCKWKKKESGQKAWLAGFEFAHLSLDQELLILLIGAEYAVASMELAEEAPSAGQAHAARP